MVLDEKIADTFKIDRSIKVCRVEYRLIFQSRLSI